MRKIFIILIISIFIISAANEDETISRTILIMPVYNLKNNAEYDYLSGVIRDTIRAKLDQKDLFNFINFREIDESIKGNNLNNIDLINEKKSTGIALSFGADVILLSKYAIEGENIIIISQAYDMLYKDISVVSSITGSTGIEIFNNIEKITNDMADKMAGKFKKIERVVLEKLILKQYGQQMLKTFKNAQKFEQEKSKEKNLFIFDKSLVFVKGGTFMMGSNNGEADEKPVHEVTVSDFWISKHEVTQKEWKDVMGSNPSKMSGINRGIGNNYPVYNISWYETISYCNNRSKKEGLTPCYKISGNNVECDFNANGYRLPTEAEWEYAAGGGNRRRGYKYSGSDTIVSVAWYESNAYEKTHPVEKKKPNELGIYDMSGNVWEWCWDWYEDYSSGSQTGVLSDATRVLRGGSWGSIDDFCIVAYRYDYYPDLAFSSYGFRVVRTR